MSRFMLDRQGAKVKVTIGCDLSGAATSELRDLLSAIHEDGVTDLTLDFSGTMAIDAGGVALLVSAGNSFRGGDKQMSLVSVPRGIYSVLQTLRLSQRLGAQMG
jgi:anti-anti-sigma regulatory factor